MDRQEILHTARIMIIDDDDDLRHVLMTQFEREGVAALEQAATMASAFEKIDGFGPDILILDVQLPDGNGFHICARLREQGFVKPIIMLTGQGFISWNKIHPLGRKKSTIRGAILV